MRREFRVLYKKSNNFYGFITTSGENLTANQAKNRALDFLEANGIPHLRLDEVYEVDNDGVKIPIEGEKQCYL